MNYGGAEIARLEEQLARVSAMVENDEAEVRGSETPDVHEIFLSSSRKHRTDIERRLQQAKAERAHELVRLRLSGAQLSTGTIQLRSLAKLAPLLNAIFERAAWRVWDQSGEVDRIDDKFVREIDLRLAAIETGSTELVILGNTAPDLTGESALESALRNVFDLLESTPLDLAERLHEVGTHAGKSMAEFLGFLEKEHVAASFVWSAPDRRYAWDAGLQEITRLRAMLDAAGEPSVTRVDLVGTVQLLSVRGRLQVLSRDTEERIRITYHRSLAKPVNELRLGDQRRFVVDRTEYPMEGVRAKRYAYRLVDVENLR